MNDLQHDYPQIFCYNSSMNSLINFSITSLSVCSGFFTLGACAFLYIQHRTRILGLILVFLASLLVIGSGFWITSLQDMRGFALHADIEIFQWMLQVTGVVMNVLVLPFLISSLLSIPKSKVTKSCLENYGLTKRETEIIEMLIRGMTNQELADNLYISKKPWKTIYTASTKKWM